MSHQEDNEDAKESLFHYTDARGLLGILGSPSLWATDIRFLNDSQEAVYALDTFKAALGAMENPALNPSHPVHAHADSFGETFAKCKRFIADELGSSAFITYVTCFCESGDLLSQWRGYGTDHGYSIEFKPEVLRQAISVISAYEPSRMLMPVHYGPEAANRVLTTALGHVGQDANLGSCWRSCTLHGHSN